MNVLVLGARIIGPALAFDLVGSYLHAKFQPKEERFCSAAEQGEGYRGAIYAGDLEE